MTLSVGAQELKLFIENDETLYRQQGFPIIKNLTAKKASGKYDHALAAKLYLYYVDAGAKKYAKDFGESKEWNKLFPKPDREAAAKKFADEFQSRFADGDYDAYIPKKYQSAPRRR